MRLLPRYRNALFVALTGGGVLLSLPAQATTINFSATLVSGSCTFSLDKSTLSLGTVAALNLVPNQLQALQPFTLYIQDCRPPGSSPDLSLNILNLGAGITQDGKWLYRSAASSTSSGVGVMVVQSATPPDYAQQELRPGEAGSIVASGPGQGVSGLALPFYAGVSCGGSTGCATVQPGTLTASVLFFIGYN